MLLVEKLVDQNVVDPLLTALAMWVWPWLPSGLPQITVGVAAVIYVATRVKGPPPE
jgi:hypothetical protein